MKIRIDEFRVGNYYSPTDGSLHENMQMVSEDLQAWSMGAVYGKPIPLNHDAFLELGFEKVGNQDTYAIKTNTDYYFSIGYYNQKYRIGHRLSKEPNLELGYNIRYIHQLQNLYNSITGEELELKPRNT